MDVPLKTHRRDITVVFTDLRNFTAFSETAEPEEVMGVLREYHAALGRIVLAHEGTVEHFAGDGVMILFNDPLPLPDPELAAVRMALEMRATVQALAEAGASAATISACVLSTRAARLMPCPSETSLVRSPPAIHAPGAIAIERGCLASIPPTPSTPKTKRWLF